MINLNSGSGPIAGGNKGAASNIVSDEVNAYLNGALYKHYVERRQVENRQYLGMSEIGHKCARQIFLSHTGAPQPPMTGEKLRRFRMGHVFEQMVFEWLTEAGFNIVTKDASGKQFELSTAGGLILGHMDGVITFCPFVPHLILPALWENKALMAKFWNAIVKHGLMKADFSYYVQIQLYMAYSGLRCCLFTAINKDTAEIHHCVIMFDATIAQKFSDRGIDILRALHIGNVPPRISANSDFHICKICEFHDYCWAMPT